MEQIIPHKIYTVCLIMNGSKLLLMNRTHDDYSGYIAPGGRVEFFESPVEGAIREVKEETGLTVKNLKYKGLAEYINPFKPERYMIFNYMTSEFEGDLLADHKEGKSEWIHINALDSIPMQDSFRRRLPLFFEDGVFEIHTRWKEDRQYDEYIKRT
ncbi:8-oxo-dGTP diphosphatase [Bacillus sp. FJAT-28004]|uniref:8-oxo-dGTP diphosphatase n=1 Tax=Bacillus sp. FJAT-28004 TaxID=1679165 RepID=UPI000AEB400F|nr:8-oxo-dGTP diphosphatase [Bacillus sp. FJAT-28004]